MYCSKCGTQNDDGALYCMKCGSPLAAPRHAASHLDSNGDGVPDVLETPTVLSQPANPTVVSHAAPTTVMESPQAPIDATRVAPHASVGATRMAPQPSPQQTPYQYQYAPVPAPAPAPRKRGGKGIIIALIAAVALIAGGFGVMYWRNYQAEQQAAEQARIEQEEAERQAAEEARLLEEKRQPHAVILPVSAVGLDSSGTRIPVRYTGTDFEGNAIDMAGYVEADGSGISLPKGRYEFTILASPIAGDGTLYEIPNGSFPVEIPENLTTGNDFRAPGTLVLSPYAAGEAPEGTLDSALTYALADPEIDDSVAQALADKASAAAEEAAHEAAEKEAREAREAAIKEAQEKGYMVLSGTVHVMNGRELCEYQGYELEQMFGDEWAKTEEATTYIIIVFAHETTLDCQSGDGSGIRPGTATMISLTKQDTSYWEEREGEEVTIAVSSNETWWPSDVSLPMGQPRTPNVQVID